MLVKVNATVVRPYGSAGVALPDSGSISYVAESTGVLDGKLRAEGRTSAEIVEGVAETVELAPGRWTVKVRPGSGAYWAPWKIDLLPADAGTTVDLADPRFAPAIDLGDGEKWAQGASGTSVTGVVSDADGFALTLSDGTTTEKIPLPSGGPAGPIDVSTDGDGTYTLTTPDGDVAVTTDGNGTYLIGS